MRLSINMTQRLALKCETCGTLIDEDEKRKLNDFYADVVIAARSVCPTCLMPVSTQSKSYQQKFKKAFEARMKDCSSESFFYRLSKVNYDLCHDVLENGGLRSLFDHCSAEWSSRQGKAKIAILRRLLQGGFSLREISWAAEAAIRKAGHGNTDAKMSVAASVFLLLEEALYEPLEEKKS